MKFGLSLQTASINSVVLRFTLASALLFLSRLGRVGAFSTTGLRMASGSASKVCVVTGSNKGIGLEIARKISRAQKDAVCVLACRDESRGREAADALSKEPECVAEVVFKALDISDEESRSKFAQELEAEYGKCDVLINNAGMAFKGSDPTPHAEQAEPTLKVNYWGTKAFTEAMIPLLNKADEPRLVFVSSMAGHLRIMDADPVKRAKVSSPSLTKDELDEMVTSFTTAVKDGRDRAEKWPSSNYGMSKLAVTAYNTILAREEPKILVNACCPGYCNTDMTSGRGPRSPEEGARTPYKLGFLLPQDGPRGAFWQDEVEKPW